MRWLSLSEPNGEIFTSLGPRRRVQRPVGNVGASAGALAALVGLLLREVHLDVLQIHGRPDVDRPGGVGGAPALAHHGGGGLRLPVALLLPPFALVLRLALSRGVLFSLGVVLVPQTVALEMGGGGGRNVVMPSCSPSDISRDWGNWGCSLGQQSNKWRTIYLQDGPVEEESQ